MGKNWIADRGESKGSSVGPRLREVLGTRRWGVATDVDGTVSALAPSPEEARVDPVCRRCLQVLANRLPLVAVISGRPAGEVSHLVGVEGAVYVGNHGLERWTAGGIPTGPAAPYRPQIAAALAELKGLLGPGEGLRFEDKGATASIHYRSAPDPARARLSILTAVRETKVVQELQVTEGKMVVELRPPLPIHKGSALLELLGEYALEGAIYLGDDLTDLDAFRALRGWRQAGGGAACAVAVAGLETPPEVIREADLVLAGLVEARRFLGWLCRAAGPPPFPRLEPSPP